MKIGGLCELRTLGCVSINTDELIEINSDSNLPSPLVHRIFRGGLILSSPDHAFPWMPPKITLYIFCYSVLRPPKVREPNGALRDYLNQEPTLPLLGLDSARLVPSCHEAHGKCLMCTAKAFKPYIAGNRSGDNVTTSPSSLHSTREEVRTSCSFTRIWSISAKSRLPLRRHLIDSSISRQASVASGGSTTNSSETMLFFT